MAFFRMARSRRQVCTLADEANRRLDQRDGEVLGGSLGQRPEFPPDKRQIESGLDPEGKQTPCEQPDQGRREKDGPHPENVGSHATEQRSRRS